jgi:hypothetical protein
MTCVATHAQHTAHSTQHTAHSAQRTAHGAQRGHTRTVHTVCTARARAHTVTRTRAHTVTRTRAHTVTRTRAHTVTRTKTPAPRASTRRMQHRPCTSPSPHGRTPLVTSLDDLTGGADTPSAPTTSPLAPTSSPTFMLPYARVAPLCTPSCTPSPRAAHDATLRSSPPSARHAMPSYQWDRRVRLSTRTSP